MITFQQYLETLLTEADAPAPAGAAPPAGGPAGAAPPPAAGGGLGGPPPAGGLGGGMPPPGGATPDLGSLAPPGGTDLGGGLGGATPTVSAANIKINNVWALEKKYWNERKEQNDLLKK